MRSNRTGILLVAVIILGLSSGRAEAQDRERERIPWTDVNYAADGRLATAKGSEKGGTPLALSTKAGSLGGKPMLTTTYWRGDESLRIEKIFEGAYGMDVVFTAGEERLVVSITLDDLTGETLVVYRLPDGEVFSLWISKERELLSGDLAGLRRALMRPMLITRLMDSYAANKLALEGSLPSAAESLIMMRLSCEDACAVDCDRQCAWECSFWGPIGCQVCHTACATGCAIGCWN